MQISKESLEEFKRLYKKYSGKDLDNSEAIEKAIYRPIKKENKL